MPWFLQARPCSIIQLWHLVTWPKESPGTPKKILAEKTSFSVQQVAIIWVLHLFFQTRNDSEGIDHFHIASPFTPIETFETLGQMCHGHNVFPHKLQWTKPGVSSMYSSIGVFFILMNMFIILQRLIFSTYPAHEMVILGSAVPV